MTTLTREGSASVPWIKICGLRDVLSVRQCVSLQIDAMGFVFAPSVRQVSLESALRLAEPARGRVQIVAVVRKMSAELPRIIKEFDPDMLQIDYAEPAVKAWLSGDASARDTAAPRALLPVMREGDPPPELWPSIMLFEGQQSGVGQLADWPQAAAWARHSRLVLAGGLSSSNVADAIRQVCPFGVDVSSAVERERGLKCPQLIEEFVMAVRSTRRTMQEHG